MVICPLPTEWKQYEQAKIIAPVLKPKQQKNPPLYGSGAEDCPAC